MKFPHQMSPDERREAIECEAINAISLAEMYEGFVANPSGWSDGELAKHAELAKDWRNEHQRLSLLKTE